MAITGMRREEMRGLRRYTVVLKRVVKMTKKGKMYVRSATLATPLPTPDCMSHMSRNGWYGDCVFR